MKIQTTKDYKMFKEVKGNRVLNDSHVKKLAEYLKLANFLPVNPIIVNEKLEVIDGQHRLAAAKRIGAEVSYVIREGARLPDVILLNSVNKAWALSDYLQSHIERGNVTYKLVADFAQDYKLGLSVAVEVLAIDNGSVMRGKFKEGLFEVKNLELSQEIANFLNDSAIYCLGNVNLSRDYVRAISYLFKNKLINGALMLKKMSFQKEKISKFSSVREALRRLEDIYNYRQTKKMVRFI